MSIVTFVLRLKTKVTRYGSKVTPLTSCAIYEKETQNKMKLFIRKTRDKQKRNKIFLHTVNQNVITSEK